MNQGNNFADPMHALNELYQATRKMNLAAEIHEHFAQCAHIVKNALLPETQEPPKGQVYVAKEQVRLD